MRLNLILAMAVVGLVASNPVPGFGNPTAAQVNPVQAAAIETWTCKELIGQNWPETLVNYPAPAGVQLNDQVVVVSNDNRVLPAQVSLSPAGKPMVSFITGLAARSAFEFRLVKADPGATGMSVARQDGRITIDSGSMALTVPDSIAFSAPVRPESSHEAAVRHAAESRLKLPGPVMRFRLPDGTWAGGSYFHSSKPDKAPAFDRIQTTIQQGPVFLEATIRYTGPGGVWYQARVRLVKNEPFARIDETWNIGSQVPSPVDCSVRFILNQPSGEKAWRPDSFFWLTQWRNRNLPSQKTKLEGLLRQALTPEQNAGPIGSTPVTYQGPFAGALDIEAWYPFNPACSMFGLMDTSELQSRWSGEESSPRRVPRDLRAVAVIPLHAGSWRLDGPGHGKTVGFSDQGDVTLSWPLNTGEHPGTVLHSGQWDPQMPYTQGRRIWALYSGSTPDYGTLTSIRLNQGYITLDDYKDWVLAWPESSPDTYPALMFNREELQKAKQNLEGHPFRKQLLETLYFSDNQARLNQFERGLSSTFDAMRVNLIGNMFQSFRTAQEVMPFVTMADEVMSSGLTSQSTREVIRAKAAMICYAVAHPDFNPRGSMVHLGNPNMPMNRLAALPLAACLIPDHPMADAWMKNASQDLLFHLRRNTAPGGGWSELVTYYEPGAGHLIQAAMVLAHRKPELMKEAADLAKQAGLYQVKQLSSPDAQYAGIRMVPGWGHEGAEVLHHWPIVAALSHELKDEKSARLALWAWRNNGMGEQSHHTGLMPGALVNAYLYDQPPAAQPLTSNWVPGVSVNFRDKIGTEEEAYFSLRVGYCISHSNNNQNAYVFYANRAPLVSLSAIAYALYQHPAMAELAARRSWNGLPRWESQNMGAWDMHTEPKAIELSQDADYVHSAAEHGYRGFDRQAVLIKARKATEPTLLIIRDSQSDRYKSLPMHVGIQTHGAADRISLKSDGFAYASPFTNSGMNVQMLRPAQTPATIESVSATAAIAYRRKVELLNEAGHQKVVYEGRTPKFTDTQSVTEFGPIPADQDALYAMIPSGPRASDARLSSPEQGVVRIDHTEGYDVLFVNPRPRTTQVQDIQFTGKSALVRVRQGMVSLSILDASPSNPASLRFKDYVLQADHPASRLIQPAQKGNASSFARVKLPAQELDQSRGTIQTLEPGVTAQTDGNITRIRFQLDQPRKITVLDELEFEGSDASVELDRGTGTMRVVMVKGQSAYWKPRDLGVRGVDGNFDITLEQSGIQGRVTNRWGSTLALRKPQGLFGFPALRIKDIHYQPGTDGRWIVVPVTSQDFDFQVTSLPAPEVFRAPRLW